MYFNGHSNWKEVYVANASSLFETLNALYSSAQHLVTIRKLLWLPFWLSGYKTDNSQQMSYYVRRIFYTIYS